ncbi:MAG: holo-ACP synthase [Candidatus Omnitrophica bacterium]|nr:holo-ACP synthase [Candidatus Omnitrophota bacterium]
MKVIGTGVDLVEVQRFKKSVEKWGDRFLNRLFTPRELAYAKGRKQFLQHLAVRFAAKEAVVKALGAPKGLGLEWKDVEIVHASSGQPKVVLKGTMNRWARLDIQLSLTHTKEHAVAMALACKP